MQLEQEITYQIVAYNCPKQHLSKFDINPPITRPLGLIPLEGEGFERETRTCTWILIKNKPLKGGFSK